MTTKITTVWPAFLIPFAFGISCQDGNNEITGEQKEYLTDSPAESDSTDVIYASFSDTETALFRKYFSPALLTKLDQYVGNYTNAKTDADLEASYNEGMALFDDLYEALTEPKTDYLRTKMDEIKSKSEYFSPVELLDEYQALNGLLGPVEISCAAECTDLDFLYDLNAMREKAKITEGKADDDFFDLVIFMEDGDYGYASYPGFKVWYVQTWDYGGYSMLGNGVFTDAVKRTQSFAAKHDLFMQQVNGMREGFVNSLKSEANFGLSKEAVLKEFDALLKLDFFTEEDKIQMQEERKKIQDNPEGYQFNCETGDCDYG